MARWSDGAARPCPRLRAASVSIPSRAMCCSADCRSPRSRACRCDEFAARLEAFKLHGREQEIARDLLRRARRRAPASCCDVGLGYLQLDRAAPTLSGGEAQRIRLAAQLGSNLQGVCYVLDEPTIGLHPRDNAILLDTLERLRAQGQYAGRGRA